MKGFLKKFLLKFLISMLKKWLMKCFPYLACKKWLDNIIEGRWCSSVIRAVKRVLMLFKKGESEIHEVARDASAEAGAHGKNKGKSGKSKNSRMKAKRVIRSAIQMIMHWSRCKRAGRSKFSRRAEIGESSSAAERRHGDIEADYGAVFNAFERGYGLTDGQRDETLPSSNHGSFPNIFDDTTAVDRERTPKCTNGRGIGRALGSVWRGIRGALGSVCRGGRQATGRGGRGRGRNSHINPTLTPVHQ